MIKRPSPPRQTPLASPQGGAPASIPVLGSLIDEAALANLADLAGPSGTRALLDQIVADLDATHGALSAAVAAGDVAALRAGTHVLMSLAGTLGAQGLHGAARALNIAAHGAPLPDMAADAAPLLADLARLTAEVALRRADYPDSGPGAGGLA